jgi:transcriptional regulator with XRE-family HTH domain
MTIVKTEPNAQKTASQIIERGERLKLLRQMSGYSRKQFGENIEYSGAAIQSWEEGYSGLTPKGALRVINLMKSLQIQCDFDWLMEGKGSYPQFVAAIQNNPSATVTTETEANEEKLIHSELDLFYRFPDSVTLNLLDNSMEPFYKIGDTVGGIRCADIDQIEKLMHQNCIVQTSNGELLCRQLKPGLSANHFNLIVLNQNTPIPSTYNISLQWAAGIIRLWRRKNSVYSAT